MALVAAIFSGPAQCIEQWAVKNFVVYEGAPPGVVAAPTEPLSDEMRSDIEEFLWEAAVILEEDGQLVRGAGE